MGKNVWLFLSNYGILIKIFVKAFAKASVTALVKAAVSWIKRRTAPSDNRDGSDATDNK
jgi:hypothetical protein